MSHFGVLRDCRSGAKGFKRLSSGDIALVDAPDISRHLAAQLIKYAPSYVLNLSAFSTGAVPNYAPQMLLDAGIKLLEIPSSEYVKNGKKVEIREDGSIIFGKNEPIQGRFIIQEDLDSIFTEAQQSLVDHMEAFFGNTIQFIYSETPLLIDGLGIPETGIDIAGNKVLVISPGADIKPLKKFIREFNPILIACDQAADMLVRSGTKPHLIVGNPENISNDALRSGASVILPASPDGHADGLERIQDLGVGAMTFPAASNDSTDLAILLADYHDASTIILCGKKLELVDIFGAHDNATPSALLARQKAQSKLISDTALLELYAGRGGNAWSWFWAWCGVLVCILVSCYFYL